MQPEYEFISIEYVPVFRIDAQNLPTSGLKIEKPTHAYLQIHPVTSRHRDGAIGCFRREDGHQKTLTYRAVCSYYTILGMHMLRSPLRLMSNSGTAGGGKGSGCHKSRELQGKLKQ
jgi:hypothetical protein